MAGDFERALDRALRYLRTRDRFAAEVRHHLAAYPEEIQDRVLSHLKTRGIVNDRRAAESYALSRSGGRGVSAALLTEQLLGRGAEADEVQVVADCCHDADAALEVLRGRFTPEPGMAFSGNPKSKISRNPPQGNERSESGQNPKSDRARAGRLLARRGFSEDDIETALNLFFPSFDAEVSA